MDSDTKKYWDVYEMLRNLFPDDTEEQLHAKTKKYLAENPQLYK